ncbi:MULTISPECIES: acyl carrier protein [Actinokineospora]|uniref:Actinorhodin polyketide synthase acyl carrier protein n=1 Tax=Actinokineospora fastidiosa TaxID=1816 RepID=A0A918LHD6_9PSEU|nr:MULTISPECIES: acyl carrier protein [Actinokineospora]UVS78752.1 Oxytetracycline polyketide synthase acyl carrier protein [Actinokineospora sp. UTMC 2448]GGS46774.1 actinorhodin polyketide synthase acyl carrier protein [Actinokineospora fastidiosa]
MTEMTLADLTRLLRECAGVDEAVDLDGDIIDVPFDELGYDSLALFNTVSRIERDHSVRLPDDLVAEVTTPRWLLGVVNEHLGQPA